jgi:outer membrane protein TolC
MKRITILFFILLGLKGISQGQTLDEYLRIAGENNPGLKADFNNYLAAIEKIPQVGSLPDPELTLGIFLRPMERFMGTQQADIQLMQMFPWFGMLRTRKDEAGKMALANYEMFQDSKNRLFLQVKNRWYEMYQLEEEIRIMEENLKILQTYERLALIRFQSAGSGVSSGNLQGSNSMTTNSATSSGTSMGSMGGGTNNNTTKATTGNTSSMGASGAAMASGSSGMSDVLRIRMEIKEMENSLALLKDSRSPLQAEFNQLLNRKMYETIAIMDTLQDTALSLDRLALLDSITQNNPMLKMLDAEEEAYEVQKKMARLEGRPMLGAGVTYMPFRPRMEDSMPMGGNDMIMPMVRVSIPIYRKKYNAMYKEAELKQQAVRYRRENTVSQLSTQWSSALRDLDDATRRTVLYRGQTGLAKQTLNLLMNSYATDGRDFEEVLRVQQQLLDYQLRLITAIVDQHTTVAMLEMLAATELN